jgi:hypothetical protein
MIPKLIHIQNGQRNYIRFSGKPAMLIEVFETDSSLKSHRSIESLKRDFTIAFMPFMHCKISYNQKELSFVIIHITDEYSALNSDKYKKNLEYAASWYLHQCMPNNL